MLFSVIPSLLPTVLMSHSIQMSVLPILHYTRITSTIVQLLSALAFIATTSGAVVMPKTAKASNPIVDPIVRAPRSPKDGSMPRFLNPGQRHTRGILVFSFQNMTPMEATFIMRNKTNERVLLEAIGLARVDIELNVFETRPTINETFPWTSDDILQLMSNVGDVDAQVRFMDSMDWSRSNADVTVLQTAIHSYHQKRQVFARRCSTCFYWGVLDRTSQGQKNFKGKFLPTDIMWSRKKSSQLMRKQMVPQCVLCERADGKEPRTINRHRAAHTNFDEDKVPDKSTTIPTTKTSLVNAEGNQKTTDEEHPSSPEPGVESSIPSPDISKSLSLPSLRVVPGTPTPPPEVHPGHDKSRPSFVDGVVDPTARSTVISRNSSLALGSPEGSSSSSAPLPCDPLKLRELLLVRRLGGHIIRTIDLCLLNKQPVAEEVLEAGAETLTADDAAVFDHNLFLQEFVPTGVLTNLGIAEAEGLHKALPFKARDSTMQLLKLLRDSPRVIILSIRNL